MLKFLEEIDWWIFNFINKTTANPVFDAFFPYITNWHKKDEFKVIVAGLLLFWLWRQGKKMLKVMLVLALAMGFSDAFTYRVVKQIFERTRPNNIPEIAAVVRDNHPMLYSFPSNHATNSMTGAVILANVFPVAKWVFYTYAGLIAYSRVYSGVHFFFDVLVGLLLGYGIGRMAWWVTKKTRWL